ncbi:MAG: hypothetical protein ACTHO8_14105 [Solirubrobacterales bacterium]
MLDVLDRLRIDWTDLDRATAVTDQLLHELAADKDTLRMLVDRAAEDDDLLAQCECHRLLDKLVLYDGLDRGFRIRMHISTSDHLDRPHDHRFSFSSLILAGSYKQVRHRIVGELPGDVAAGVQEDHQAVPIDARVEPEFATTEQVGSFYTIHHSVIHTTIMEDDTVSLFIRGPAEKERSLITDRDTGRLWWRYGAQGESPERRAQKVMDKSQFAVRRRKLEVLGVT